MRVFACCGEKDGIPIGRGFSFNAGSFIQGQFDYFGVSIHTKVVEEGVAVLVS